MRRRPITLLALAALAASAAVPASAPADAEAAKAKSKSKRPSITRVTPMRVRVGATMTIRGRNFSSRRKRNTVIFRSPSGRSAFAKPTRASRKKLVVKVPAAAAKLLSNKPTRFKLRVLAGKFSSFTSRRLSPVLVPSNSGSKVGGTNGGGANSCAAGDFDGDLLPGARETQIKTDPCLADTDGDGVEDGYEQQSAIDLNFYPGATPLPYPGKRPYPNALDPSDANTDYDGDAMALREESLMWLRFAGDGAARSGRPGTLSGLLYSDGLQRSRGVAAPAGGLLNWALDLDEDGVLGDDERDADGDGISNWDEARGQFFEAWWPAEHDGTGQPKESKYPDIDFLDNEDLPQRDAFADTDMDGDGVADGADDNDHDGLSNQFEVRRPFDWFADAITGFPFAANPWAYTNPFNPCKPFNSERCHRHPPFGYYDTDQVPPIGPHPPAGYPAAHPTTPDG